MSNFYNLDGIKTELAKRLDDAECLLSAWQAITFPTKTDGTPFASMAKNIIGAKYSGGSYAIQPGENKLTVYAQSKKSGYIDESIDCYCLVKYLTDESKKAKTQNYMLKQSYLEQIYCYDLEDIKQAINDRITKLLQDIERLNNEIEHAEKVFIAFRSAYANALETLASSTNKTSETYSDLYYLVKACVIERYPYC